MNKSDPLKQIVINTIIGLLITIPTVMALNWTGNMRRGANWLREQRAYQEGADWLILRVNNEGRVTQSWELKRSHILPQSYTTSFRDEDYNTVYVDGEILMIRVDYEGLWDKARARYLEGGNNKP